MKLAITLIVSTAAVTQAWVAPQAVRTSTSLNAVYYSTSTGNTETIAGYIAEAAGAGDAVEIGDASDGDITGDAYLIVGATTWDDWLYETLPNLDLDGKKVAIFGCGDQESYA